MTLCDLKFAIIVGFVCLSNIFHTRGQNIADFPIKNSENDSVAITITALPKNINTSFSEYCGILLPDSSFWFSSMRADAQHDREHFFETNWYCYIYNSELKSDGMFASAQQLPRTINNPKYFNSNFWVNKNGTRMLFSRCTTDEEGELICSLWETYKDKKGWKKPKKLPEPINGNYSSLQPYIVDYEDYSLLYFVSDRPSGFGALDIWYSIIKDGKFQTPVNLGPIINTEGNDVTPFYDKKRKCLFFSSDERKGFGDYDIWMSYGALGSWQKPSLLPQPFNSEYNDLYFNVLDGSQTAFLSSNRPTDISANDDTCCNDIYRIDWLFVEKEKEKKTDSVALLKEKIASVLPITLYFQNDSPDPRSLSDTTDKNYLQLHEDYVNEIQNHIRKSGQGLIGDEQREAMYAVSRFMYDSVQTGYDRLKKLTEYLIKIVEFGDSITLEIRGYASPLHNSEYNRLLSCRRIISLKNYLREYKDGLLKPCFDAENAQIKIKTMPEGAIEHSFETEEIRETVFGLRAAKDRKIVITQSCN